jgi:apurinic endonuclease APN1
MKIGFHISKNKGFDGVLRQAMRLGCDVVQIFLKNPRSWIEKRFKAEDIEAFKRLSDKIPVFAHLSYLPNLAKIDIDEKNIKGFLQEALLCRELGINAMVVHCGSREDRRQGIEMTATAIDEAIKVSGISILIENSSGQGNGIGKDISELSKIYASIARKECVSLCMDTAHIFQAGYDIRIKGAWDNLITEIDKLFGKEKIGLIHLNDSKTGLGSRIDRHWHIGRGQIGLLAFKEILNNRRITHIPCIMETPNMGRMDEENMETVRSLLSPLVSGSSS